MPDPNSINGFLSANGVQGALLLFILAVVAGYIVPRSSYLMIISMWEQRCNELKANYARLETRYDDMKSVATENTRLHETLLDILEILETPPSQRRGRLVRLRRRIGERR